MEKVRIVFLSGDEIEAEVNGGSYIVDEKPDFPSDLTVVTIIDAEGTEKEIKNAQLVECASVDGRYWFAFNELSEMQIWQAGIEDAICELSEVI